MAKKCKGIFKGFIDKNGKLYSPDQLPEYVKDAVENLFIQAEIERRKKISAG
jgi:hypothetical protein